MVYLQVHSDGTITDCIDYQHGGYTAYDGEVPQSVHGGWFKLIDGKIIEYPELKPKDEKLETEVAEIWYQNMVAEARIEKSEQEVAGLWYEIMTMGGM